MNEKTLNVALQLFNQLPFWKRNSTKNYFIKNGWDVTGEWQKCVGVAIKMIDVVDYNVNNVIPASQDKE